MSKKEKKEMKQALTTPLLDNIKMKQPSKKDGETKLTTLNPLQNVSSKKRIKDMDEDFLKNEGLFIKNYFAKFTHASFHKENERVTALCVFEDRRKQVPTFPQDESKVTMQRMIAVTGASNGVVKLWDILQGEFLADLIFHRGKVKALTNYTMPDGNTRIVSGSDNDCMIAIWDFSSGQLLREFERKEAISCLAVCQKTGTLAVGSADKRVAIYNIKHESPQQIIEINDFLTTHTDLVLSLAIVSPDEDEANVRIVTVGWDKRMMIWDKTGDKVDQFEKGHRKSITTLIAHCPKDSEEAPVLVTGSLDRTAIIWDFATLKKIRTLQGHTGQVNAVKISDHDDDGFPPVVLTASQDRTLIIWDLLTGYRLRTIEHNESLLTLAIIDSTDGIITLSSGQSPCLLIWDLRRTHRSRKFLTGPVTTIDTYTPLSDESRTTSHGHNANINNPQIIIGSTDKKFTVFQYRDNKTPLLTNEIHLKRINAGVLYQPPISDINISSIPLVISADSHSEIKVWELNPLKETYVKKELIGHKFSVFSVAVYDPTLFGRTREPSLERVRGVLKPSINADSVEGVEGFNEGEGESSGPEIIVDLRMPVLLSAGGDNSVKVWDFLGILGNERDFIAEIADAHTATIRSVVIHHPIDPNEKPSFITGSFDMTTALWDLETLTPLRLFANLHTESIVFTAIYDPKTQYPPMKELPSHKVNPTVITSGYDDSWAAWDMCTGEVRLHKKDAHRDSVTALAVFTPPMGSTDDPLVVTGSIDRMIHVWNLFSGDLIRTLVGHTDRVSVIKIYDPPGRHPVILSGGDDSQTIWWEDSLYSKPFMPVSNFVMAAFEADLETVDWPMITYMAETYGSSLFVENPECFTIALQKGRADFLLKFWDYLTLTLPLIKPLEVIVDDKGKAKAKRKSKIDGEKIEGKVETLDLLSLAVHRCDLVALRAILLAWIKNVNQDMDDILSQRISHPCYYLSESSLNLLYEYYPVEFAYFFNSIRLINNCEVIMGENAKKYISPLSNNRYEFQGSFHRVNFFDLFWKDFEDTDRNEIISNTVKKEEDLHGKTEKHFNQSPQPQQYSWIDQIIIRLDLFIITAMESYERILRSSKPPIQQPVTSLMVPLTNCNHALDYLMKLERVAEELDDCSIFDSEVVIILLQYFWRMKGRRIHMIAFFHYLIFFILYLICIYSFQDDNYDKYPSIISISVLCMLGFAWLGYEEFAQMKTMFGSISFYNALAHFADLWNAVDMIIVVNGLVGLILRIAYDSDTSTGRAALAICSVFMWFKMLYFLRPFSSTGPLVSMILRIATEIQTFLLVLFLVLAGFAQAFWLLENNDETLLFGTVSQAFLNAFLFMLGQGIDADFSGAASPYAATVFLIFFMIIMMILMLNLLIALMGDIFSKVLSQGTALWRKEQAAIIIEESFTDSKESARDLPPYLFVLKYESDVKSSSLNYQEELQKLIEASRAPGFTPFQPKV